MSTVKNTYIYVAQMAIGALLPLITVPIITRTLPPDKIGMFILAQVYGSVVVGIAMMGLATGYERNYFQYKDDLLKTGSLLYTVTLFSGSFFLISGVLIYFWREYLADIIFDRPGYSEMLIVVYAALCLQQLSHYYLTFLKNKGSAASFSKITILQSLLYLALVVILLVYMDYGVMGLAYALFISNVIVFAVTTILQSRMLPFSLNKHMLSDVLKISLPLTPRVLFGALGTQFDKMMLGMQASIGAVGIYGIGHSISNIVFKFMTALDHVFIPEMYNRFFSKENKNHIDSIGKYLVPFFYMSILAAMGVALFSEELFIILLPESYYDGINVVIILTIFYASMFFGKISGTQLIYAKKTHITSLLTITSIIINIVLNVPMIIMWGTIGAALATMIAGIINVSISYVVAQRYAPIRFEWNIMMKMTSIFVVAILWTILTRVFLLEEYWMRLAGKIILVSLFILMGIRYKIITVELIRKSFIWQRSG